MTPKLIIGNKKLHIVLLLLCGVLMTSQAAAQRYYPDMGTRGGHERLYLAQRHGEDLDRAASRIQGRTGGKVMSKKTRDTNGRRVHYIRILNKKGGMKDFRVDAESGETLPPPRRR